LNYLREIKAEVAGVIPALKSLPSAEADPVAKGGFHLSGTPHPD
jgi:hypothetical protein